MEQYTVLIKDDNGLESTGVISHLPSEGETCVITTRDENGNIITVMGEFVCEL